MEKKMNGSVVGRVLMINKDHDKNFDKLSWALASAEIELSCENDLGAAIRYAQIEKFDVILLDANIAGMPVERIIQILKEIDPTVKLIVKTDVNSKELESKIRKETIYYYHLDSFGTDDLCLAIKSAVSQKYSGLAEPIIHKKSATEKKLILIVDEDDNFIEIHKTNLENHNFEVDISYDADEAIKIVKEKKPALMMIDMSIPVGGDGLHFMEMVLADEDLAKIPMLILLSVERMAKYEKIMERIKTSLSARAFLEKPVKIEDVIPQVDALLKQNKSLFSKERLDQK